MLNKKNILNIIIGFKLIHKYTKLHFQPSIKELIELKYLYLITLRKQHIYIKKKSTYFFCSYNILMYNIIVNCRHFLVHSKTVRKIM